MVAGALLVAASLGGCDKPAGDATVGARSATPSASPAASARHSPAAKNGDDPLAELPDLNSEKLKHKAASAFNAIDGYLKEQDPKLREKLRRAADKLTRDKDKWRERLTEKKGELQPEIERLRSELAKASTDTGDKSSDALRRLKGQLDNLQLQNKDADQKLAELESATGEAWKSFKEKLKEEQKSLSAEASPDAVTPAPSRDAESKNP